MGDLHQTVAANRGPGPGRSFCVIALTLLGACGETGGGGAEDLPMFRLNPDPVAEIGLREGPVEYLFNDIRVISLLPDGRIVVGDQEPVSLRLFASDGDFIRRLAREGEGPGEFMDLRGLWTSPPDTLHVVDFRLTRVTTLKASGEVIATARFDVGTLRPGSFVGAFADNSFVLRGASFGQGAGPIVPNEVYHAAFSLDGENKGVFYRGNGKWAVSVGDGSPGGLSLVYHPFTPVSYFWTAGDHGLFYDGFQSTIRVMDRNGELVRKFPTPENPLSPEASEAILRRALDQAGVNRDLEAIPRMDLLPSFSAIVPDAEGDFFWAKQFDPGDDSLWLAAGLKRFHGGIWQLFDVVGNAYGYLTFPDDFELRVVRGGVFAGVRTDRFDVESVVVYEVNGTLPTEGR